MGTNALPRWTGVSENLWWALVLGRRRPREAGCPPPPHSLPASAGGFGEKGPWWARLAPTGGGAQVGRLPQARPSGLQKPTRNNVGLSSEIPGSRSRPLSGPLAQPGPRRAAGPRHRGRGDPTWGRWAQRALSAPPTSPAPSSRPRAAAGTLTRHGEVVQGRLALLHVLRPLLVADEGAVVLQEEVPGPPGFDVLT